MLRELAPGEVPPVGFRIAYFNPLDDVYVAWPIGLHWAARLARRAWEWSQRYRLSEWERAVREMVEREQAEVCRCCLLGPAQTQESRNERAASGQPGDGTHDDH